MAQNGRGITNKQSKYLAALQKELGLAIEVDGLSRQQAHLEIARLRLKVDARDRELRSSISERVPRPQYRAADGSAG